MFKFEQTCIFEMNLYLIPYNFPMMFSLRSVIGLFEWKYIFMSTVVPLFRGQGVVSHPDSSTLVVSPLLVVQVVYISLGFSGCATQFCATIIRIRINIGHIFNFLLFVSFYNYSLSIIVPENMYLAI